MQVPVGLVYRLCLGFVHEWGTHTHAAVNGWAFPADYGSVMSAISLQASLGEETGGVFPWSDFVGEGAQVTDAEFQAAVDRLAAVSAIAD